MQITILPDAGDGVIDVVAIPGSIEEDADTMLFIGTRGIPFYWDKQVGAYVFPRTDMRQAQNLRTKINRYINKQLF